MPLAMSLIVEGQARPPDRETVTVIADIVKGALTCTSDYTEVHF